MAAGPDAEQPSAFPIRSRLRLAVVLSLLLAIVGGVGFVGLLRMSALKVHKAIVLFGEPATSAGLPAPLALAVRSLESGRLSAPSGAGSLTINGTAYLPKTATPQNLLFQLQPDAGGAEWSGIASASARDLEAPPLPFTVRKSSDAGAPSPALSLAGLGVRIRMAARAEDEVPAPTVAPIGSSCRDTVTLIPVGGVAQRFMQSRLLVRITDAAGTPRSQIVVTMTAARLGASLGKVAASETDDFGLAQLEITLDSENRYGLTWECGGSLATADVSIGLQNDGMVADWRPANDAGIGALHIETTDLRPRASWQSDLFCNARWTQTDVVEHLEGEALAIVGPLTVDASPQPCLWQASGQPYLPHPQHVGIWLLSAARPEELRAKALALFDRMSSAASGPLSLQLGASSRALIATSDPTQLQAAVRWMLSWLPRRFEARPVLADSAERDQAAMRAFKEHWRRRFECMLGIAVAGLIAIWLPRAILGLLADQRRLRAAASDTETSFDPSLAPTRVPVAIAGLVIVVVLAVAAILAMVWVIS